MYAEFAKDPKVQSMSEVLQRRLVMLFCLQCSDELTKLSNDELAIALRIETQDIVSSLEVFRAKGFIDEKNRLRNWVKRQFKSDVSTERVRAYRKRKGNVSETKTKRFSSVSVSVSDSVSESVEKKGKIENQKAPKGEIPPGLDLAAWSAWEKYRQDIRKPLKPASILAAQRKLAAFGSEQHAAVEQSIANGWAGLFPVKHGNRTLADHNLEIAKRFGEGAI